MVPNINKQTPAITLNALFNRGDKIDYFGYLLFLQYSRLSFQWMKKEGKEK